MKRPPRRPLLILNRLVYHLTVDLLPPLALLVAGQLLVHTGRGLQTAGKRIERAGNNVSVLADFQQQRNAQALHADRSYQVGLTPSSSTTADDWIREILAPS